MLRQLHQLLVPPTNQFNSHIKFWFGLSLIFATLYGILALQQAFSSEYVVQDDARQHVFWMRRFLNSELFPNDLIADYFQSVAPLGYTVFYRSFALLGIDPLWLSKVLPIVLGLITTAYSFGVCLQLLPIPMTGFIGSILLNQNLWMQDGLISATPKAFIYPLFLAFLYYFLRRSFIPCLVAIALLGLFYPSLLFVCILILVFQICHWHHWRLHLSHNRQDYAFCIAGIGVAVLILLPYALSSNAFAPTIAASTAKTLPEFLPEGRSSFFNNDSWQFWFNESRSGIRLTSALMPPLVYVGLLLPIMWQYKLLFPLAIKIRHISILPQLILASLVMFSIAHALIFKLHLPSRYTQHSLRIVMTISAAIALTLLIDTLLKRVLASHDLKRLFAFSTITIIAISLLFYPCTLNNFLWTGYIQGNTAELYQFFQRQPQDTLIASLADEANNLPTFAQRSILVGSEYAIPYHWGYYRQFRQRTLDLIQAQYSQDLMNVQKINQKYGVDFWLLEKNAFTPEYIADDRWIQQFQPFATNTIQQLQQKAPALSNISSKCAVFEVDNFIVLQAKCIQAQS
ncbi:hypothetical protein [Gloeocapsopsis dulcis]|uniref:Glycosyltransferase RgtA/B/C/D-like domain-containing protein n=1 Tax=Gloeocapsopsis dulcis AAB1 = 1H9 TaxID=1433147 RepID=A0A6N8G1B0_9CHRO|nr:hypothetical protein [Gloeocapsopsis dulcis]MUL38157.1 hypothetical protein [Gloeocapsopsis dulcis AAB1 = 1H9]WNN90810.1 hypothetical protein P0S91_06965 [Gloeocapsopsis dulcis]